MPDRFVVMLFLSKEKKVTSTIFFAWTGEDLPEGSSSFLGRAGEEAEEATPDEWEAPGEEGGYDGHGGGEYNEDEEDDWENVTEAGDDDQEAEEAGTGVLVADPSPEVHEERKIINEEFAKWTRKVGSYQKELEHARGTAPDHHETAEKITALQPLVIEHKDLLGTFQEKCEEVGSLTTKILALVNSIHGQRVALVLQKYHQQQLQLATQQVVNANKKLRSTVQKHVPGAALGAAEDDEEDDEEEYPGGEAAEPEAQDLEGENLGEVADLEAGQARAAAAGGEPMDGEAADRDDAALPAATPPAALPRSMSAPVRGPGIRNGANTLPGDCTPAQQQQYDNLRRADPDVRAATGLFSAMEGGDGEDSVSCASARQSNAQLQGGQADVSIGKTLRFLIKRRPQ
ncbi:unnamed protein product [Amoebophrya sp. A120]|nr:unnamed protein product [Amoebophrya sp. A120]|eukprot:GSA120T00002902001.1